MRYLVCGAVLLILPAGCIKSTGPDGDGDEIGRHRVTLAVSSITVRAPCDEFPLNVDGGEWSHRLTVHFPGGAVAEVGGTANYPSPGSMRNANAGDLLAINASGRTQTREIDDLEGATIELRFAATEWDYDLFGTTATPDTRMNNRQISRGFTFSGGSWPLQPNGVLTLQNTAECRVEVNYAFQAEKLQ